VCEYFELDDCGFVIIEIAVVRRREEGDDCWEFLSSGPFIHLEPLSLRLVGPDYRNDLVLLEETLRQLVPEKVGTPAYLVVLHQLVAVPGLVIDGVRPDHVAEESALGDLAEAVDLLDVVELGEEEGTVLSSGEMPPWRRRNLRLTRQARGRQSNISITSS